MCKLLRKCRPVKRTLHKFLGGPMARVGTVDEKTQSACMARAVILHGTSSDDPVTYKYALNNSSHQCDLPKDESNGSKLFINAIKHGGTPSGKWSESGDDEKGDTKPSGKNSGDTKPADKDQDDSKPLEKINDDKDPSKDKKDKKEKKKKKKKDKKIVVKTVDSQEEEIDTSSTCWDWLHN